MKIYKKILSLMLFVLLAGMTLNGCKDSSNSKGSPSSKWSSSSTSVSSSSVDSTGLPTTRTLTVVAEEGITYETLLEEYFVDQEVTLKITSSLDEGDVYEVLLNEVVLVETSHLTYTFKMPNQDSTLKISKRISFDITKSVDERYAITIDNNLTKATKGTTVKFAVTLTDANTVINSVKVLNTSASNAEVTTSNDGEKYTFTMPEGNVLIDVTLSSLPTTYKVNVEHSEHVTVSFVKQRDIFEVNELVSFEVIGAPGYGIDGVYVRNSNNDPINRSVYQNTYTFTMPASDVYITISDSKRYQISIENSEHTTVTIQNASSWYDYGYDVSFTVTAANGYLVDSVKVFGESEVSVTYMAGLYTFEMPKSDARIVVTERKTIQSNDPFKEQASYRGDWYYGGDRYVQVDFNGDGTLNWYVSYDEYDDDYWYAIHPLALFPTIPGTILISEQNIRYTYDEVSKKISITYMNQAFTLSVAFSNSGAVQSIAFDQDVKKESTYHYYATAGVRMTRVYN